MILQENKILIQKAAAIWITKNFNQLREIYDKNCIHHQQNNHRNISFTGIKKLQKYMEEFLIKYPDYHETILTQIAENDKVVSILNCHAKNISWSGVIIDRIQDKKIKETWAWFKRNIINIGE